METDKAALGVGQWVYMTSRALAPASSRCQGRALISPSAQHLYVSKPVSPSTNRTLLEEQNAGHVGILKKKEEEERKVKEGEGRGREGRLIGFKSNEEVRTHT